MLSDVKSKMVYPPFFRPPYFFRGAKENDQPVDKFLVRLFKTLD